MSRIGIAIIAGAVGSGLTFAVAWTAFPRINAAENYISSAIGELQAAPNKYGGHKTAAIRLLNEATSELQAAKANFHG